MNLLDDTIVAVASPPGGAARAIVRLSGPRLRNCLETLFRPDATDAADGSANGSLAAISRPTAVPGRLWLPRFASPTPCELYLWPSRRSYTGQPVAELHMLGSPPLAEAAVAALCAGGARVAEPGEFTLRAFLAGRMDLTQAEAVLGVIDAADAAQLQTALGQLAGGLARPLGALRHELLDLLAHLEAGLDFADEDLPLLDREDLIRKLDRAAADASTLLAQVDTRRDGSVVVTAVLTGRPNTGKSSLFNRLAQAGALVSGEPGTTRDYLTADIVLDGLKCRLIDTAGIERHDDELRQSAQAASAQQHRRADVRILCLDGSRPLDAWERDALAGRSDVPQIVVVNKSDLPQMAGPELGDGFVATSCRTGAEIDRLRAELRRVALSTRGGGEVVQGTAIRCRQSLVRSAECLAQAAALARDRSGEELVAAELCAALDELGAVVGAVYTEDVLERIFSRFCVGK